MLPQDGKAWNFLLFPDTEKFAFSPFVIAFVTIREDGE